MRERKPYFECPKCGSAAVEPRDTAAGRRLHRCTRCGHRGRNFSAAAIDPNAFDNRPREGGRLLPIRYGRDQ